MRQNQKEVQYINLLDTPTGTGPGIGSINVDWLLKKYSFFISENGPIQLLIHFPFENVWIDDLFLLPK